MSALKTTLWSDVAFHDLDIMAIVWHGHYFKYFERARCQLMASLNLDWPELQQLGYAMPMIDFRVKYRHPLTYGQKFAITAEIGDFDGPALDMNFQIVSESGQIFAEATSRQCYFAVQDAKTCFRPPEVIHQRFCQGIPQLRS